MLLFLTTVSVLNLTVAPNRYSSIINNQKVCMLFTLERAFQGHCKYRTLKREQHTLNTFSRLRVMPTLIYCLQYKRTTTTKANSIHAIHSAADFLFFLHPSIAVPLLVQSRKFHGNASFLGLMPLSKLDPMARMFSGVGLISSAENIGLKLPPEFPEFA